MTVAHTVKPGDSLVAWAYQQAHPSIDPIWQHADNESLRNERPDPAVLAPGDVVHVPPGPVIEKFRLSVGREHEIVVPLPWARIRLQLVFHSGVGHAVKPVEIAFDGGSLSATPDAEGRIDVEVPGHVKKVTLTYAGAAQELALSHLQPVSREPGIHARLENLGYSPGPLDGDRPADPYAFRSAIEEFQCDTGLTVDGIAGEKTQDKLRERHGA